MKSAMVVVPARMRRPTTKSRIATARPISTSIIGATRACQRFCLDAQAEQPLEDAAGVLGQRVPPAGRCAPCGCRRGPRSPPRSSRRPRPGCAWRAAAAGCRCGSPGSAPARRSRRCRASATSRSTSITAMVTTMVSDAGDAAEHRAHRVADQADVGGEARGEPGRRLGLQPREVGADQRARTCVLRSSVSMRLVTRVPVISLKILADGAGAAQPDHRRAAPTRARRRRRTGRRSSPAGSAWSSRPRRPRPARSSPARPRAAPSAGEPVAPEPPPGRDGRAGSPGRAWAQGPGRRRGSSRPAPDLARGRAATKRNRHFLRRGRRLTSPPHLSRSLPMTLSRGRDILAIPGPSIIPDRVLNAMHRAAPNIYEGELIEITETLIADLKRVARTEGKVAIYIGNGHAGWEAAIANILRPGQKALVAAIGPLRPRLGGDGAADGRRGRGDRLRLPRRHRRRPARRAAARRPRPRDPRGAGGADRHRLVGAERRGGAARRRSTPPGIRRSSPSTASPASAATASRWTPGASM